MICFNLSSKKVLLSDPITINDNNVNTSVTRTSVGLLTRLLS